mmetsp:Transcript_109278/g.199108  ORF Transcript_109278/g.199108 Transcript_109278/m.199108 type:complete len:135 (+) Transcript_109278:1003-1407(+)
MPPKPASANEPPKPPSAARCGFENFLPLSTFCSAARARHATGIEASVLLLPESSVPVLASPSPDAADEDCAELDVQARSWHWADLFTDINPALWCRTVTPRAPEHKQILESRSEPRPTEQTIFWREWTRENWGC